MLNKQDSLKLILEKKILNEDSIIIAETDDKDRILNELESIDLEVFDIRKYGRVYLIFLK